MGTLSLKMAGVPLEKPEHIYIQVSGVEITGPNGTTTYYYCQGPGGETVVTTSPCTTAPAPMQIDFIALGGSQTITLLDGITLPTGRYGGVRILVDSAGARDSYIVVQGGAEHEFQLSEQDRARLYVAREFEVPANGHADWIVVFDLRKSIRTTDLGDYVLVPHWRMVDSTRVGSITGVVRKDLVRPFRQECPDPVVYVFAGHDVMPDDIDGDAGDPVTTAITTDRDSGHFYRVSFIEAGEYTINFSCIPHEDKPDVDDSDRLTHRGGRFFLFFLFAILDGGFEVTVNAQAETEQDL